MTPGRFPPDTARPAVHLYQFPPPHPQFADPPRTP